MTLEVDVALCRRRAWQCIADACLEHDLEHERRALAELHRLEEDQRDDDQ